MVLKRPLLLLALICFLTYLPSLGNKFVWDDEQFIYKNQYVLNFDLPGILTQNTVAGAGVKSNYYRPFTTLTFAVDHSIWGLQPFGFHLFNVFLHMGAGLFLYLLLKEMKLKQAAFWIALIFLIHPLQTEAVTYINSRGESLYAFFTFLGLFSFTQALKKKSYQFELSDRTLRIQPIWFYFLSALSFVLGVLSKETTLATVGLYILVGAKWWHDSQTSISKAWKEHKISLIFILVLICISAIYLFLRSTILNFDDSFNFYGERNRYTASLLIRLLTFSKILWIYLKLIIFPYPLHMERDTQIITSLKSIWPWLTVGLLSGVSILGWWEYKKHRTIWIIFGGLWFLGMLAPVSGIVPINGLLYEHWLYVPLIGFFIIWVGIKNVLLQFLFIKKLKPVINLVALPFLLSLATIFIGLTLYQNYLWRSPIPFYTYTLQYADSARLRNNLANEYADNGQYEQAVIEYQKALSFPIQYPQAHFNLGNTYLQLQQYGQAETEFKKSLTLDPQFSNAKVNLLLTYLAEKKIDEAKPLLKELLALYPDNAQLNTINHKVNEVPEAK